LHIPKGRLTSRPARQGRVSRWVEGQRVQRSGRKLKRLQGLPGHNVPDTQGTVMTDRDRAPFVEAPADGIEPMPVAAQRPKTLARTDVPQSRRAVITSGERQPTIATEPTRADRASVSTEFHQALAGGDIPKADLRILRRGQYVLAVIAQADVAKSAAGLDGC